VTPFMECMAVEAIHCREFTNRNCLDRTWHIPCSGVWKETKPNPRLSPFSLRMTRALYTRWNLWNFKTDDIPNNLAKLEQASVRCEAKDEGSQTWRKCVNSPLESISGSRFCNGYLCEWTFCEMLRRTHFAKQVAWINETTVAVRSGAAERCQLDLLAWAMNKRCRSLNGAIRRCPGRGVLGHSSGESVIMPHV
jgi:hypothetical protein